MGKRVVDESSLTSVADAIRERAGTSEPLVFPEGFVSGIASLFDKQYVAAVVNRTVSEIRNEYITVIIATFQQGNKNLITIDLPNCETAGVNAFNGCGANTIKMPKLKKCSGGTFQDTESNKSLYLPSLETMDGWGYDFHSCSNMEKVYFPKLKNITVQAFSTNPNLRTVILGSESICTLENANAFSGTPIADGTGYFYVPRSLLSDTDATKDYRRATNWSTYASQFRAKEDYPEVLEGWE